jgi:hypothetical protein
MMKTIFWNMIPYILINVYFRKNLLPPYSGLKNKPKEQATKLLPTSCLLGVTIYFSGFEDGGSTFRRNGTEL